MRPEIDRSRRFDAEAARHPVVEAAVKREGEPFTPNDCRLDGSGETAARLAIVTGPEHGRQVDLPAPERPAGGPGPGRLLRAGQALRLGVVDRLFSRVGAGDDLARGRSTFMAEMVETAAILTQATPTARW